MDKMEKNVKNVFTIYIYIKYIKKKTFRFIINQLKLKNQSAGYNK